ncbi:MAG TPA: hypothetical protein VH370_20310 [Humisphaera sp.]|jgi:hypothetical protein|nr:hypothetical protein [Humisphaera sp.]
MFGNQTGWIISIPLALAMIWGLVWSSTPMQTTKPTNDPIVSIALAPIKLDSSGLKIKTPDARDAGLIYREAIIDYLVNRDLYQDFHRRPALAKLPSLPAIDGIVKAGGCSSADIFRSRPKDLINYRAEFPEVDALTALANMTIAAGLLYKSDLDYDKARTYINAGFELGRKMFDERLTFVEMGAGLGLMQGGASALQALAKDKGETGLSEPAAQFAKDAQATATKLIDCYKIIGGIDETYYGRYSGDIFKIATSPTADPMWRVEALKHIGHYQYSSVSKVDQIYAKRLLQKMAADSTLDPIVKTAAVAARDLSLEEHRNTR